MVSHLRARRIPVRAHTLTLAFRPGLSRETSVPARHVDAGSRAEQTISGKSVPGLPAALDPVEYVVA
jgi:hypothetical protein